MPGTAKKSRAYAARPVPNLNELPDDALLTDAHVSVVSTFPVSTLKYWRANDRGPRYVKVEGHPRYRAADVRAWINGRASDRACPADEPAQAASRVKQASALLLD